MTAREEALRKTRALLRSGRLAPDEAVWFQALERALVADGDVRARDMKAPAKKLSDLHLEVDEAGLYSSGAAPVGKPVEPAPALRVLPKAPPSRRRHPEDE